MTRCYNYKARLLLTGSKAPSHLLLSPPAPPRNWKNEERVEQDEQERSRGSRGRRGRKKKTDYFEGNQKKTRKARENQTTTARARRTAKTSRREKRNEIESDRKGGALRGRDPLRLTKALGAMIMSPPTTVIDRSATDNQEACWLLRQPLRCGCVPLIWAEPDWDSARLLISCCYRFSFLFPHSLCFCLFVGFFGCSSVGFFLVARTRRWRIPTSVAASLAKGLCTYASRLYCRGKPSRFHFTNTASSRGKSV